MEMQRVWAVYFSGTGTTEKVVTRMAKIAAEDLGAEYKTFCFNLPKDREGELSFGPEDLVVVGTPVYAGRVPNLLLPYIRDKVKGNGALAVPVSLFGNRNFDDGLIELRNVLEADGFHTVAGGAFVGEHSFSRTLGAGRPDAQDMALVEELAHKTAEKVKGLERAPEIPAYVAGCAPIRPYYTPRDRHGNPINILKVKPKTDMTKCGNCGWCAAHCPMGSIDPDDPSQVPGTCIKCCACVKGCPTGAKYYDDPGYLYHKSELEEVYARPAENALFV